MVLAAFNTSIDKSVFYGRFKTPKGAGKKFVSLIESKNIDYISVRVINRKNYEVKTLDTFIQNKENPRGDF